MDIVRDEKGRFVKGQPSYRGMLGKKRSPEAIEKSRQFMLLNNPFKGKRHTEESKEKMREKRSLYRSSTLGKSWTVSDEARENMTASRKRGPEHHMWKGGITTQDKMQRVEFRKKMQRKVFERDDFTCQICMKKGTDLQVDHIKKWSDFPELRFEMSNCRTLCMDCHYFITYGRKKPEGVTWGHNLSRRIAS